MVDVGRNVGDLPFSGVVPRFTVVIPVPGAIAWCGVQFPVVGTVDLFNLVTVDVALLLRTPVIPHLPSR